MSPYHYRLDWETWIHVTASLEQLLDSPVVPLSSLFLVQGSLRKYQTQKGSPDHKLVTDLYQGSG